MSGTTYKAAIFARLSGVTMDDLRDECDLPRSSHISDVDPQHDNDTRARFAAAVLVAYVDLCGDCGDMDTRVADLLADMRHLCDALAVDYQEADDTGGRRHDEEIRGVL